MRMVRWHSSVALGAVSLSCSLSCAVFSRAAWADDIVVKVFAPDGQPAPNVQVFVSRTERRNAKPLKTLTGLTNAAGEATFDLQPARPKGLYYGNVTLVGAEHSLDGGSLKKEGNEFHLGATRTLRGQVVDEEGKPLAGAGVSIDYLTIGDYGDDEEQRSIAIPPQIEKEYSAVSDATGNWQIAGLPEAANARVVLNDERYVAVTVYSQPTEAGDIIFTARPGAVVVGRIIDNQGKPVVGLSVYGSEEIQHSSNYATAITDEQGQYRLQGLSPTKSLTISSIPDAEMNLAAPILRGVEVSVGKVAKAPDIKLVEGITLTGVVTDKITGKPIEGVSINLSSNEAGKVMGSNQALSGADGRYEAKVLPGEITYYASQPDYIFKSTKDREDAAQKTDAPKITVAPDSKPTLDITLDPRPVIAGIAVDPAGKLLPNIRFRTGERWNLVRVTTDAKGAWTTKALDSETAYFSGQDNWVVVEPKEVKLPAKSPIRIVLKPATFAPLKGRIISTDGKPIAGAQITLDAMEEGNNSSQRLKAVISDADGRYEFTNLLTGRRPVQVTSQISKYLFVSGPDYNGFRQEGQGWTATDLVMAPLAGTLSGKILSNDGQPVAGAYVVADRGAAGMVKSAADGSFSLSKLIEGEMNVTAFTGNASKSAHTTVTANPTTLTLTLQTVQPPKPRDVGSAYEILAAVIAASKDKRSWQKERAANMMFPFDAELAAKLRVLAGLRPLENPTDATEEYDPSDDFSESNLRRLKASLDKFAPKDKKVYGVLIDSAEGLNLFAKDAAGAAALLQNSENTLRGLTTEDRNGATESTIMAYAMTGSLAAKLGKPSAQTWADFVLVLIDGGFSKDKRRRDDMIKSVLGIAARGGDENYARYTEDISPGVRVAALGETILKTAKKDPKAALTLMDQLEAMPTVKQDDENYDPRADKDYSFGAAAVIILEKIADTDPVTALALARRVQSQQYRPLALALAAHGQTGETRNQIYREALKADQGWNSGMDARIVSMAYETDPVFGKTLFDELIQKIEVQTRAVANTVYSDVPAQAFYIARYDSAAARRFIEGNFAAQKANLQNGGDWQLSSTAVAMSPVDLNRALEMALSIGETDTRMRTQSAIAAYALASEAERRVLVFSELSNGTWQPGKKK